MSFLKSVALCAIIACVSAVTFETQKTMAQRITTMVYDKYDMGTKESSNMFSFIANMDT